MSRTPGPARNDSAVVYLNDHLAGSVGAIELIDRVIEKYDGQPIAQFCRDERNEIKQDQEKLRALMAAAGIEESSLRQAGAWVAEKVARPKLSPGGNKEGDLGLLQALESLVLGVKGKELLWHVLANVRASWPPWRSVDFEGLEKSAIEQGARIDEQRTQVARTALRLMTAS